MSIEMMYAHCGLPISCEKTVPWEGQLVMVQGMVHSTDVFNRSRFPQLPYEKFKLTDSRGHSVEVWPQADDNQPIFDKLARRPQGPIRVSGRLAAVKLPSANRCLWGVKVLIDDPSQIEF